MKAEEEAEVEDSVEELELQVEVDHLATASSVIRAATWQETVLILTQETKVEKEVALIVVKMDTWLENAQIKIQELEEVEEEAEAVEVVEAVVVVESATFAIKRATLLENAPITNNQERDPTKDKEEMMEDHKGEMTTKIGTLTITMMITRTKKVVAGIDLGWFNQ